MVPLTGTSGSIRLIETAEWWEPGTEEVGVEYVFNGDRVSIWKRE